MVLHHKRMKLSPFCGYIKGAAVSMPGEAIGLGCSERPGDQHLLPVDIV